MMVIIWSGQSDFSNACPSSIISQEFSYRNLSVSTILTWKILKIQIRSSKSQNKAHFCNLWEKQMQIDTHFNETIDNDIIDMVIGSAIPAWASNSLVQLVTKKR